MSGTRDRQGEQIMTADTRPLLTSTHWGTYRVDVEDGRVTALRAFEHDPDPSAISHGIVDVLDGPTRIHAPMIRNSWLEGGPVESYTTAFACFIIILGRFLVPRRGRRTLYIYI